MSYCTENISLGVKKFEGPEARNIVFYLCIIVEKKKNYLFFNTYLHWSLIWGFMLVFWEYLEISHI